MRSQSRKSINIIMIGIALIAIFFIFNSSKVVNKKPEEIFINNAFATTSLKAKAAYVYSPNSKSALFELNANIPLPLASVTKIMTAYVASTILSESDIVTIQSSDLSPEGDVGFNPGERWKFSDIRDLMLVASANDAAEAIRRTVDEKLSLRTSSTTIGIMNEKAKELGLNTLLFRSVSGLDDDEMRATSFGSAKDISLALAYVIHNRPDIFESTREESVMRGPIGGSKSSFKNTNVTINQLPSIIASKTGYTDTAGGNLVTAFDAGLGSPIIVTVLGSTDQNTRFDDMLELSDRAIRYINGAYRYGK